MPKNFKLKLTGKDETVEQELQITFTDEDWRVLQDFSAYASELKRDSSIVRENIPSKLNLSWEEGSGLKTRTMTPPAESVLALLQLLRPFVLNDESTYFFKVRKILNAALKSEGLRRHLGFLKRLFSGEHNQSQCVIIVDGPNLKEPRVVNSEDMLRTWLYGFQYHRNRDERQAFEAAHALLPSEVTTTIFNFLISDKVKAILALQDLIAVLDGRQREITLVIPHEPRRSYLAFVIPSIKQIQYFWNDGDLPPLSAEATDSVKVFDLSSLGPVVFTQSVDLIAGLWAARELNLEVGTGNYCVRFGPGFQTPDGQIREHGVDLSVAIKIDVLLLEEHLSEALRKPAHAALERMKAKKSGRAIEGKFRAFESKEELDKILESTPKPNVEWVVAPRIAFQVAYWPLSKRALRKIEEIASEGRKPTFAEVEGPDILRAWEDLEKEEG